MKATEFIAQEFRIFRLISIGQKGSFFQKFGKGARNCLGVIERGSERLKKEIIVIGAHYDSVCPFYNI